MLRLSVDVDAPTFPEPDAIFREELERGTTQALALLEREVKIRTPRGATGAARGSIGSEVRWGRAAGLGRPVLLGLLGSPLAHVPVLEHGRRPGQKMPPPDALVLWVRRKLTVEVKGRGGKVRTRRPTLKEAEGIAFVIARSIAAKGTEAVRMFEQALEENEATVFEIFDRTAGDIVLRLTRHT